MASEGRAEARARDVAVIRADLEARELLTLAKTIAARHHVTLEEMLGRSRVVPIPLARRDFWLELTHLGWSYPRIGALCGYDHTTVLTGVHQALATLRMLRLCVRCAGVGATASRSDVPCELCNGAGKAPPTANERRTA